MARLIFVMIFASGSAFLVLPTSRFFSSSSMDSRAAPLEDADAGRVFVPVDVEVDEVEAAEGVGVEEEEEAEAEGGGDDML